MYQFDFIRTLDEDEQVISVMAKTYPEAIKKMRDLKLPDFDLTQWHWEGAYESGVVSLSRSN